MRYNVFISYSRKDTEIIDRIEKELHRYGIKCFIDRSGINPGEDYAEVISKALFESDIMLFVWSENSNQSRETANEVALAIDFEKPVIPFKIGKFQADYKLAYRLVRFNRIDAITYNEQKIIELGEKIAHQLGKALLDETTQSNGAQTTEVAKPQEVVDPEIEQAYRDALELMRQFKVAEAFDAIYPLAIIGYKDSFDRLLYFTDKKTKKFGYLSEKQIEQLHQDADNGISVAKYLYSIYLRDNSNPEAFRYAQEAVDDGFVPAKLPLAKCYDLGVGVKQDNNVSSRLMVEAKDSGDLASELEYIRYLCYGYNFKADKVRALRMWEALDEKGVAFASYYLAGFYIETENWDSAKAIEYADKAISEGIIEAYNTKATALGYDRYFSIVDPEQYMAQLMKGAEYNERNTLSSLALAYYAGHGVEQNLKHAVRWAKRSAALGDTFAMYLLNQIYYYGGEGIEENEEEAWRWAKLGEKHNAHPCIYALGNMCRDGYGMEGCERKDCVKFYERAIYLDSTSDAGVELYKIYSEGKFGFPRDMAKAVSYLKPVAEGHTLSAALHYGKLLTDIDSDYCDEFLGVKYLNIACEAGYAEAYYRLGKLYEVGFGVPKDTTKAKELIQKAKELGYEEE